MHCVGFLSVDVSVVFMWSNVRHKALVSVKYNPRLGEVLNNHTLKRIVYNKVYQYYPNTVHRHQSNITHSPVLLCPDGPTASFQLNGIRLAEAIYISLGTWFQVFRR